VQIIRSVSLFGLSYVSVYFEDNVDIYFARRLVMERPQEVSNNMPLGYGKPEMGPNSSGLGQVFWNTLERADDKLKAWISDMDLCTLQDWTVRLILRTAPGVDHVTSWGGQEGQYQMRIDPLKLIAYDLDYSDVIAAVDANNRQIGGQYIDRAPNSIWCVHSGW
jgi:heavy metal efflux system protein